MVFYNEFDRKIESDDFLDIKYDKNAMLIPQNLLKNELAKGEELEEIKLLEKRYEIRRKKEIENIEVPQEIPNIGMSFMPGIFREIRKNIGVGGSVIGRGIDFSKLTENEL